MFVAWRDLRFAKGRFLLISGVVALITVLVGFLSGLTAGLADQNISAVLGLPADSIVFSVPAEGNSLSYSDSAITEAQAVTWSAEPGVTAVRPIGISQVKVYSGERQAAVAVFGADPGVNASVPAESGHLTLPRTVATSLSVTAGDSVKVGGAEFTLDAVTDDTWYSHTAVAWMTLADWQGIAATTGNSGAFATVLAVSGSASAFTAAAAAAATTSKSVLLSLTALAAFRSEIGSLLLMVAMLFGISALVVGAFFTVWGMQRQPDVAILKALGASNRMLVVDSLGQAAAVLVIGVGAGIGLTAGLGITGPSGSGKSSLLAVVSTLIRADSGSVVIDDIDVSGLTLKQSAQFRRERLGIIFQQSNLLPSLTALDQLLVMERLSGEPLKRGSSREADRRRALELLDSVGLSAEAHKRPASLSGGERQRVNIARALMNHPTVLVIDEPTASLDQARGTSILNLILELTAQQNTATLLVTHDENQLARFARHYVMVDGTATEAEAARA
ncbi:ATP-binding cassette domain-containing protein [Subtercola frigoramans]|uniref:ABC-type lipoprotein export system ATPase subunit n=1 Tax=Subtercola frigoramans TaxID=120298 RepID=A0ABS2L7D4_9MICO|nr:ATP-binding cassette domain-containing protein [Subtercola frigoramans]MBM7473013.1 ABC-type lipoprotein export system ATPase subunit [Subtercola frigoramans]